MIEKAANEQVRLKLVEPPVGKLMTSVAELFPLESALALIETVIVAGDPDAVPLDGETEAQLGVPVIVNVWALPSLLVSESVFDPGFPRPTNAAKDRALGDGTGEAGGLTDNETASVAVTKGDPEPLY